MLLIALAVAQDEMPIPDDVNELISNQFSEILKEDDPRAAYPELIPLSQSILNHGIHEYITRYRFQISDSEELWVTMKYNELTKKSTLAEKTKHILST